MSQNTHEREELPELPEPVLDVLTSQTRDAEWREIKELPAADYYTADQMRSYGEQCRAASVAPVDVEELIGRLYAAARHVDLAAKKLPDAFNGWEARDIVSAIEKLRALSRGVPEGK